MRMLLLLAALSASSLSMAVTIDFEDLLEGDTLGSQYSGVTFASGTGGYSVPNPAASTQGFATVTGLTVTSTDLGVGVTAPLGGKIVHSFGDWNVEDGDAVVHISFATAVSSASIDVGGMGANFASTVLYAFDGASAVDFDGALATGSASLAVSGASITDLVLTLGDWNDWVGFDNLTYQPVPEPASMAVLGIGVVLAVRRRRNKR